MGLREFLGSLAVSVPVSTLAKWKTVVQMVAIGFLLAGSAGDKIWPCTTLFGLTLLWIAAIVRSTPATITCSPRCATS